MRNEDFLRLRAQRGFADRMSAQQVVHGQGIMGRVAQSGRLRRAFCRWIGRCSGGPEMGLYSYSDTGNYWVTLTVTDKHSQSQSVTHKIKID